MKREKILIDGMHCASCALLIEGSLKKKNGIFNCNVNLLKKEAYIEYDPEIIKINEIIKKIEDLGYKVLKKPLKEGDYIQKIKKKFLISLLFSVPVLYLSMGKHIGLHFFEFLHKYNSFLQFLLTLPVLLIGIDFFKNGFLNFIKTKKATMDTLISLGVGSAFFYSFYNTFFQKGDVFYEISSVLITIIFFGRYLEEKAKGKTNESIKKLIELKPKFSKILRDGKEMEIPVNDIKKGDIVIVKPGDRIPVDGIVIDGYSSIDESMIKGESIPEEKFKGSEVFSGTINLNGTLKFEAVKVGNETFLSQIIKIVEEAEGTKPPIQKLADVISSYFVPVVLFISILCFLFWFIKFGDFGFSLKIAISVLIISCPCALGLATPLSITKGLGIGAKNGILFKNGEALQKMGKVDVFLFDKTGTLTKGKPEIYKIIPFENFKEEDIIKISSILSKNSSHPFSETIINKSIELKIDIPEPESFEEIPGKGLRGIYNGEKIYLGKRDFFKDLGIKNLHLEDKLEDSGYTIVFLGIEDKLAGIISFFDNLKDEAGEVINKLKENGKKIIILTGDNEKVSKKISEILGVDDVFWGVFPEDKINKVKELRKEGKMVCFVGDGINDAPALTEADLGIALGSGKDIAIEAGDIILIKNNLRDILKAIFLSNKTMKKIKQNLFWAFFYNIICIPVAGGLLYQSFNILLNPLIAGLAMSFSSLFVVLNSLTLRKVVV